MDRDIQVIQSWNCLTPPVAEPVSLTEARDYCRVDSGDASNDAVLTRLIAAARDYAENYTRRQLMPATWVTGLDRFPWHIPWNSSQPHPPWVLSTMRYAIRIPRPPLISVTSLEYYDANQVNQVLDPGAYVVDSLSEPAYITPPYGRWWPGSLIQPNTVRVTYRAGFADAAHVPERIRQAILMLVAHWYDNRPAVVIGTISSEVAIAVQSLLSSFKTPEFY